MNLGFKAAQGKYICMLSDDCLVIPGAIENGVALFEKQLKSDKRIGAIAFYWRNWPEQTNYWVGVAFGERMFVNHGIYLREALAKINFVDEDAYSFYHADGDLCLRLWDIGYKCIDSPTSFIEHYSDANSAVRATNLDQQQADWNTYTKRWASLGPPKKDWIEINYHDVTDTAKVYWTKKNKLLKGFKR
jgi:GT2 family glycosyltransferase